MPTYIVLASFTEQGIKNVKDSPKRADAVKDLAKKSGATMKEIYWTLGQYDIVGIFEAPDDQAMTALGLNIGKQGNVRTRRCVPSRPRTCKGYSARSLEGRAISATHLCSGGFGPSTGGSDFM